MGIRGRVSHRWMITESVIALTVGRAPRVIGDEGITLYAGLLCQNSRTFEPGAPLRIIDWQVVDAGLLPSVAAEWDHLVETAGYPPFLQAAFLRHLLNVFGSKQERLALGRCNGQLIAGTLLSRQRQASGRPSSLHNFRSVPGSWRLTRICSNSPGPCWQNCRASPCPWDLTQLDPRFDPRPMTGGRFESMDYVPTGWVDITGNFEDYSEARGKNLRQNLRKHRRKLEEQGAALRFDVLEAPEDVDRAFLAFAQAGKQWLEGGRGHGHFCGQSAGSVLSGNAGGVRKPTPRDGVCVVSWMIGRSRWILVYATQLRWSCSRRLTMNRSRRTRRRNCCTRSSLSGHSATGRCSG